ncbi:uncharacterized protein troap [Esox lucius]|nr:uncharacterized protein troap [Esox lucius]
MDSSSVLRQQSYNKTLQDNSRFNRMTADPKPGSKNPSVPSRHQSVPCGQNSRQGSENQDPTAGPDNVQKPLGTVKPISRLPVLAKSLQLQTPSDFTQSHMRWEQNSLAGKAKRKKPCTKPVPFNFSSARTNRIGAQNQRNGTSALVVNRRAGDQPTRAESAGGATAHSNERIAARTAKLPSTLRATHTKVQSKSTVEFAAQLPARHSEAEKAGLGLQGILSQRNVEVGKTPAGVTAMSLSQHPKQKAQSPSDSPLPGCGSGKIALPRPPGQCGSESGISLSAFSVDSGQPAVLITEACRGHFDTLSLKEPSKPAELPSANTGDGGAAFSSDPAALCSILRNEGISAARASTRPSTRAYNNMPQRVSIMKTVPKTLLSTGPARNVQFTPDAKALGSILQNEGVRFSMQPQRVSVMKSQLSTAPSAGPARSVQFSPQPSSLSRVLQNEGPCNPLQPLRVSVMKSQLKTAPPAGQLWGVAFSPDSGALSSILRNEGVTAGSDPGAMTQNSSVRPSGRGTSIYTAQRVPVTKNCSESPRGPTGVTVSQTPCTKWTPQRVPNSRPLSMRKVLPSHRTPYEYSPRLRGLQSQGRDLETHKEEVVQRLFETEEEKQPDEQALDQDPAEALDQDPAEALDQDPAEALDQDPAEALDQDPAEARANDHLAQDPGVERNTARVPTFFQAPHRESVIIFSTGRKLLRAAPAPEPESPAAGFLECGGPLEHGGPLEREGSGARATGEQKAMDLLPRHPDFPRTPATEVPEVTGAAMCLPRLAKHSAFLPLSQPRGSIIIPKSGALSSAAALLRLRLPLEELRLEEEVATYTSALPAPPCPSFGPLPVRCGNPVASALCLQDFTSFHPIILDPSSAPSSPCSSLLQER